MENNSDSKNNNLIENLDLEQLEKLILKTTENMIDESLYEEILKNKTTSTEEITKIYKIK